MIKFQNVSILLAAVAVGILMIAGDCQGKVFTRCQLAKELMKNNNFQKSYITNWVCLVENESNRNTTKITPQPNRSENYGIFQINSKDWCRTGRKGGLCKMRCEDFLNDDILDDSRCAIQIYKQNGFKAWSGWVRKCRGRTLPDVSQC